MTGFFIGFITGTSLWAVVYLVFKKIVKDLDGPNKHKWE